MKRYWLLLVLVFVVGNGAMLSAETISDHLSEEALLSQLEQSRSLVEVGSFYAHYRNPDCLYKVIGLSIMEGTQEVAVIYQKQSGSLKSVTWIRPISSWLEKVSVEGKMVDRFQKV